MSLPLAFFPLSLPAITEANRLRHCSALLMRAVDEGRQMACYAIYRPSYVSIGAR